jgi:hypothetical protein
MQQLLSLILMSWRRIPANGKLSHNSRIHRVAGEPTSQDSGAHYNNLTITITRMMITKRPIMMISLALWRPDESPLVEIRLPSRHQIYSLYFSNPHLRALPHRASIYGNSIGDHFVYGRSCDKKCACHPLCASAGRPEKPLSRYIECSRDFPGVRISPPFALCYRLVRAAHAVCSPASPGKRQRASRRKPA